jgi:predicted 3-demethylubiquinone-9 3-methyltransferase (glyoxalase superfamily)
MEISQKITPFLMYNDQAGEAMEFYTSIIKNSRIVSRMPGPDGKIMGGSFEIEGLRINCFNGGAKFEFTQGFSLMIKADTQEEVDHLYESLSEGGKQEPCGWLDDKFGVSWQVTPTVLLKGLSDPKTAGRVAEAMFKMHKIIIADVEAAMIAE